ncbi:unnamed protein product [Diatraea saccharalis]|uniref:Uncharacterized protein n=1 Tax=Diatraea saccharalis TaxID=40085 RepID=A0A9N9R781_9NEOP|nr:unnamed protein product [Diatraea saccharalis]
MSPNSNILDAPCYDKDNILEYKKLVPKIGWNCKYCINDPIGGKDIEETQPLLVLEDILEDIAKLKLKLNNLLNDVDQVKTDLIDLKATTTSTHTYMKGVNAKVKNLEDRIVKLDKTSCNFYAIRQTIVEFENDTYEKENCCSADYNKVNTSQKQTFVYPNAINKAVLPKDQNSFVAKVHSRLRNAPKLLLSSFSTDSNKKNMISSL